MLKRVVDAFLDHPRSIGMSYTEHARRSIFISFTLGLAGVKALVHAIIPALFTDSSTKAAIELKNLTAHK